MPVSPTRARALDPDERRASIIEAVIPLLLEHGTSVTSRQIADAAGVAEGTVFRAFGDKESLIDAAVEAFLAHSQTIDAPLPDPEATLESKVAGFLQLMRGRVRDVMRMAAVTGRRPSPPNDAQRALLAWRMREVFGPHESELALGLDDFGSYLRMIAIGTTAPSPGAPLSDETLVSIILDGVRRPAPPGEV